MPFYLLIFCLLLCQAGPVFAQSPSPFETPDISAGNLVEFVEGEYIVVEGFERPETGWQRRANPYIDHANKAKQPLGDYRSMAARFYFDRDAIGHDPAAIYLIGMRGNFSVSVNSDEVFRNYADISDQKNSWYRPFLVPVPDNALKAGFNEITVHSFSKKIVGVGRVIVGSNSTLQAHYNSAYFWHITAPTAANFAMVLIGLLVFIFWLARKHEMELLWFSISAVLWFMRNHEYFAESIPINIRLYRALAIYPNYFAIVATAAFYFCFIKLPHRNRIIFPMFALGIIPVLLYEVFGYASIVFYVPTIAVISIVSVFGLIDILRHRNIERGILGAAVLLLPVLGYHDVNLLLRYGGDGHATYLTLFCGLVFATVFIISFGKRVLEAFVGLERSNVVLEQSISQTRAELAESEAIRQELLVDQAIATERGRLMQEMHDGIGSNLTTALAVARQQEQPASTVTVLQRALGDLKLTVDSLEPVGGDLVALIGNLRHRMARDLADAGITCKWDVGECQPLTWLDATNALHVLRIHNEAISNVLAHSNATAMRIGCVESLQDGVAGISTYVADNGDGFEMGSDTPGKGLANMRARAHSLSGKLHCTSEPGNGTKITLWIPYDRGSLAKGG